MPVANRFDDLVMRMPHFFLAIYDDSAYLTEIRDGDVNYGHDVPYSP
jgi:hypothetical protein